MTEDEKQALAKKTAEEVAEKKKAEEDAAKKLRSFKCHYTGHWINFNGQERSGKHHIIVENHGKIPNWPKGGVYAELTQRYESSQVRFGIGMASGVLWLDYNGAYKGSPTPGEAWNRALLELAAFTHELAAFSFVPVLLRLGISAQCLREAELKSLEERAAAARETLAKLEAQIAKLQEPIHAPDPS